MKIRFILLWTFITASCGQQTNQGHESAVTSTQAEASMKQDTQTINLSDSLGLKQGRWSFTNKQGEKETYTYKNDTLNGYYCLGNWGWRHQGTYKNGIKDNIQWTYSGNKGVHVSFLKNGTTLWSANFNADKNNIIPVKGFQIPYDTTLYLIAPYPSGKKWYEGQFISTKKFRSTSHPGFHTYMIGIHKIYFEEGALKAIVDYDHHTITEFNSEGRKLYSTTFNDVKKHEQMISSVYLK